MNDKFWMSIKSAGSAVYANRVMLDLYEKVRTRRRFKNLMLKILIILSIIQTVWQTTLTTQMGMFIFIQPQKSVQQPKSDLTSLSALTWLSKMAQESKIRSYSMAPNLKNTAASSIGSFSKFKEYKYLNCITLLKSRNSENLR